MAGEEVAGMAKSGDDQKTVGDVLGDAKAQAGEIAGQVHGAAQDFHVQARKSASQVAGAAADSAALARDTTTSLERALRNMIETQPYTTMLIALGLGWFFGRMHRPL